MEVRGAGLGCGRGQEGCKDGVQGEGNKVFRERMGLEKGCCEPKCWSAGQANEECRDGMRWE